MMGISKATKMNTIMISTMTKEHLLLVSNHNTVKAVMAPNRDAGVMTRKKTLRRSVTSP